MTEIPIDHSPTAERMRTYAIMVYALYLLALPSGCLTMLIGVIVAYLKRDEARGMAFESHFRNAIDVFWISLVVGIVGFLLWPFFFLGGIVHAALVVWVLYRSVKGILRAIEWQAYA